MLSRSGQVLNPFASANLLTVAKFAKQLYAKYKFYYKHKRNHNLSFYLQGVTINTNLYYILSHKQYLAHVLVLTGASLMYKRMWYLAQIDVKKQFII